MTLHDRARELADAIKESPEYTLYMEAKEKASANPELTEALNDFREKQYELQKKQMMGEEIGPDMMSQMQELSQILMRDAVAAEYLQAEVRFTLVMNDIFQMLTEVAQGRG
jgi:cell fate (sporulation/competence/biofilm development) regulator YlbF (YheA/YmcA/DUF963 family)